MKDLYLRLGISPDAGKAEISASDCDDKGAADYRAILLDPQRRDGYDRTFAVVKAIGILRSRLGLDSGPSWFQDHCPDFVPPLRASRLAERDAHQTAGAERKAVRAQPAPPPVEVESRRWWPWVLLLLAAAAAIFSIVRFGA